MDGTGSRADNRPLRVLETLVGAGLAVMVLVTVLVALGTVVGSGSIPGVDAEVCATGAQGSPAFARGEDGRTGPVGLRDGVTWRVQELQVCDSDPDVATRALGGLGLVVWAGAPAVFLAMLWRFLRRARTQGVFADEVPPQLRTLGRFLMMWALLDFFVSGAVNAALLTRMTDDLVFLTATVPWVPLVLGVALLALARVMEQAVEMRRDVEATI